MSKNPANRGVGDHLKEGGKNIKTAYQTLYNRKQMGEGVAGTVKNNLKIIATGKSASGMPKAPASQRARMTAMGAASVTPLGPVAAFASGVAKSVKDTKAAIAKQNAPKPAPTAANAPPKTFMKIKSPGTPATGAAAATPGFKPGAKPLTGAAKGPTMGARASAAKPGIAKPAPGGAGIAKKPPTV